jgi:hypothetical protein
MISLAKFSIRRPKTALAVWLITAAALTLIGLGVSKTLSPSITVVTARVAVGCRSGAWTPRLVANLGGRRRPAGDLERRAAPPPTAAAATAPPTPPGPLIGDTMNPLKPTFNACTRES